MSRVRLQLAVSADGFIAPSDRSLGWLEPFPADQFGFAEFFAAIGSVVLGRTSWEEMQRLGPSLFESLRTVVLTSRPLDDAPPATTTVTLDGLAAAVEELRRGPKDVWLFGGAQTLAACLDRRLVDSIELAVIPRLLGQGIPLFAPRAPTLDRLRLVASRPLEQSVLWLEYAVER